MPNNPVQIVLNDEAFLRAPDPQKGGADKDFFEGRDAEFVNHRQRLIASIETIARDVQRWPFGPLCYLRVRMRPEAIAKSYRPNRAIFLPDQFPCVGAGAPGELYFRGPLFHFTRLLRHVAAAEDRGERRVSRTTGKPYHYVTRNRCEVGAIESIELAPSDLKRSFAADAAVAALSDPRAASGYIVELFEGQPLIGGSDQDALGFQRSVASLQLIFREGGAGLFATLLPSPGGIPAIEMLLTKADVPARIEDRRLVREVDERIVLPAVLDRDVARHETILQRLAAHPLVRRIRFPVLIEPTQSAGGAGSQPFPAISKVADGRYPKVGIIDTGVDGPLKAWVLERHDFLDEADCDPSHGTLVAGVLIGGRAANSEQLAVEEDGCNIVDLALMPRAPFSTVYGQRGFEAFLEELEAAISEAKDRHGVRIFNMSLNVVGGVHPDSYSLYAARLDDIQDRLGVLIVNSAGNLPGTETRAPWPAKPAQALAALAARTNPDTIYMPCESVRTVAVGALNPPGSNQIVGAPATYTRRGPGLRVGVKPDVAHFGGTGHPSVTHLTSCDPTGHRKQTCGTSFAAPLVAKTIASLDIATGERLAPRTLRAFLIHNASLPEPLASPRLRDIARQFAGFGRPSSAAAMLQTEDHAITMVFESRLTAGERRPAILRFDFQWPAALIDPVSRACRGLVSMTLAYDAPIDQAFGTEFVRVNLSAHLRQRQPEDRKDGKPSFRDQISQAFLPRTGRLTIPEKSLIEHGLKWWPTKRYAADFKQGVGQSAEWRLEVESVVRAEATFPAEGIPFSVILTIEDEESKAPIFQTFRQTLLASRVDMQDIRTAVRVRPRSR